MHIPKEQRGETLCDDEKATQLMLWLIVLTLVAQAALCLLSLHVGFAWKGTEQHEAGATVSAHVTWFFSTLPAAIMVGHRVKGTTVARHAGIHGQWVTLPPVLAALEGWRHSLLGYAGSCLCAAWKPTYGALVLVRSLQNINQHLHFNSSSVFKWRIVV